MTTRMMREMLSIGAVMLVLAGCTGSAVRMNQPLDSPVDFTRPREISSEACGFQLLLVIPVSINDRYQRAYNTLTNAAYMDYMTNVRIEETWTYCLVGTMYCTKMYATAYPRMKAAPVQPDNPLDQIQKLKKLKDEGAVTNDEYEAKKKELLDKTK